MTSSELWLRIKSIFTRKRLDQELQDEMAFHLAMKQEKLRAQGVAADDVRAASLRQFGNLATTTESTREAWMFVWLENLAQDLRYAGRMLRKSPALTAVVIISLALGIGANTAIFSVLDSVLLATLPVQDARHLVLLQWSAKGWPERVMSDLEGNSRKDPATGRSSSYSLSYDLYQHIRRDNHVFDSTVAFAANNGVGNIGLDGRSASAGIQAVSGNYFDGLRVAPVAGRVLSDSDDTASAPEVCMVSYQFWQARMGGDRSAVGKPIAINGTPTIVVGVLPPEFFGLEPGNAPEIWIPLSTYTAAFKRIDNYEMNDPKVWYLGVVGRLKPGISLEQARSEVRLMSDQFLKIGSAEVPRDDKVPTFDVMPMDKGLDQLRYQFSTSLYLLMGMVGLVLLIACANVAGLLLAKAAARRQEIAVRMSLGAPRFRLIRQLLTESVLLALLGGVAGLVVAKWSRDVLVALLQTGREPINVPDHSNLAVLAFTAAVSIVSGILFGIAPAVRSTRADVMPALKQSTGKGTLLRGGFRSGKVLVSAQVALCLLLLISAGLLLRTLDRLQNVALGFERENMVTFRVHPGYNGVKEAQLALYYEELQRGIAAIPGVRSVGFSQLGPVGSGSSSTSASIPGYTEAGKRVDMYRHKISPGYFETLGVPTVLGRTIGPQDTPESPKVVVINQRFVRDYMRGENPIGRQIQFGSEKKPVLVEIVGVVPDVKYARVRDDAPPTFYMPYIQQLKSATFMTFLVRTTGDPRSVMTAIQQEALKVNKDVPVVGLKTESELVSQTLFVERMFAVLSSTFGGLALLLACVGLYGTIGYTVTQRTNEIGVRMALGATRERILGMILRETLVVVIAGIVIGLPLTWYATQVLKARLFGLSPHDASTILWSLAAILVVTVVAGFQPARRAAKVDPMVALRYE